MELDALHQFVCPALGWLIVLDALHHIGHAGFGIDLTELDEVRCLQLSVPQCRAHLLGFLTTLNVIVWEVIKQLRHTHGAILQTKATSAN
ncbi:hypothetical protein [Mesorhizobium sp.]|uniref:hypothetical protein n=1 Tax=Mesorhizobium sp. TaxID=1871066 RepID=UPI0012066FDB|nr:hypothetical protein [Mesorhizobium sp.]TIV55925.1 MAG: hypothetical protein E5V80_28945 [Mesorhizobium sp.]